MGHNCLTKCKISSFVGLINDDIDYKHDNGNGDGNNMLMINTKVETDDEADEALDQMRTQLGLYYPQVFVFY